MQQHLHEQGPFAVLLGSMLILGSFINFNQTDSIVEPSSDWCKKNYSAVSSMPDGLGTMTILMTFVFPMTPLLLNSQAKAWNRFKFEMVKNHVVGQGSVFGMSEALRHILTVPEPTFLQKCNISVDDCNEKTELNMPQPLNPIVNKTFAFCNSSSDKIFDSLHHFPDNTCCLIGASIVSFLATLYFWNRANMSGKSIYDAHSLKQYILISSQLLFVGVVLCYLYFLYKSFDSVQIYGLLIGGIVQFMIICSTLPKHNNNNNDNFEM